MVKTKDGELVKQCRHKLEVAGFQQYCFEHGFYGLAFSKRKFRLSDILGSIAIYYASPEDEIVALWQENATGEVMSGTFIRAAELGDLGVAARIALDDVHLLDEGLASRNGGVLEWVRCVLEPMWQQCHYYGFVSRPRSMRPNRSSLIPGSSVVMYDSRPRELAVCWQRELTGPVQIASFVRSFTHGKLAATMFEATGIVALGANP